MENFDDTNIFLSEEKLPKGIPFTTPEGYFDSLKVAIEDRIKINDFENKPDPFGLPKNYFENLVQHIENKIANKEFEKTIHHGFFENQEETILSTIAINEKIKISSPFEVPEGYFENLVSAIEVQTTLKQKSSVLKFTPYKWAYAAAVAIVLSFGIIYYSNTKPVERITAKEVKDINPDSLSTSEIVTELKKSDISEEELIKHIDSKDINTLMSLEDKDLKNVLDELNETDLTKDM